MATTAMDTKTKGSITLQGSAAMIREFFHYGIQNILYQRGIYSADSFIKEKRFGMSLLVSSDIRLQKFLEPFLAALEKHLSEKNLRKMVVALYDVKTKEVLERWVFDIQEDQVNDENSNSLMDEKRVRGGMANVLRQITAAVAFLPHMEAECSFDVLIGLKRGTGTADNDFEATKDQKIQNAECVPLRSFATGHHDVKASVEYKSEF
uniref:HORMA domain-containing protein n=1 Tax=Panagrolaimus superbus TaxID=310955 RepID=A0A914YWC2_9BILA